MEIKYFDELDSTQKYLLHLIKEESLREPLAIICNSQSAGVGSRGNSWSGQRSNFFASISFGAKDLPSDLPLLSVSLYFGWLMVKLLRKKGKNVWLKWPNDIYFGDNKVGGLITNQTRGVFVVGIGINLRENEKFRGLGLGMTPKELLVDFLEDLEKMPSWEEVFGEFSLEFYKSKEFMTHIDSNLIALKDAKLQDDGS